MTWQPPSPETLVRQLQPEGVGRGELELVVREQFGSAVLRGNELVLPNDWTNYALKITYDEERIQSISAGPVLTEDTLASIIRTLREDVAAPGGIGVGNTILFSHGIAAKGWWKYRDRFQILPAPAQAPMPDWVVTGGNPFMLECRFPGCHHAEVRGLRKAIAEQRIVLLLHTFLRGSITPHDSMTQFHWVRLPSENSDMNIAYCQTMYTFNGLQRQLPDFSSTEQLPPLKRIASTEYYNPRRASEDSTLDLPDHLERLLDAFFTLPEAAQDRFLRASYWLRHSHVVHSSSKSAGYIALVQAIESLLGKTGQTCGECGQPRERTTRRFAAFLATYVPGDAMNRNARSALYAIRSAITHGEYLFDTDRFPVMAMLDPAGVRGLDLGWTMRRLTQQALIGWLLSQTKA